MEEELFASVVAEHASSDFSNGSCTFEDVTSGLETSEEEAMIALLLSPEENYVEFMTPSSPSESSNGSSPSSPSSSEQPKKLYPSKESERKRRERLQCKFDELKEIVHPSLGVVHTAGCYVSNFRADLWSRRKETNDQSSNKRRRFERSNRPHKISAEHLRATTTAASAC